MELPTIIVDKELYIMAPMTYDITRTNKDPANASVLLSIQDDLYLEGLKLIGKTDDSMIFTIEPGGSLQFKDTEVRRWRFGVRDSYPNM
jgi:hypothetical protein